MHIDRIPVYRVYQRAIDLELYHACLLYTSDAADE